MTRLERLQLEMLEQHHRSTDDRIGVTLGRAAQMLRMTRQAVLKYVHAGGLRGEWIEGAEVRAERRVAQLVLRKGEVRRFRQALEDQRRRNRTGSSQQLGLPWPLVRTARAKPTPWPQRWRPVMAKVSLPKAKVSVVDRQPNHRGIAKGKRRVA
jgi:hypothetical protein